jgi:hypothetical protein
MRRGFGGEGIFAHYGIIVSIHKAVPSVTNTVKSVLYFSSIRVIVYHISRRRVMQRPYLLSSLIISSCTVDRRVDIGVKSVNPLYSPDT